MELALFTAKDVHACFPWISGTTLFNRIKKGLIPTEPGPKGPGYAFQLSLAGLVHVGIVDELCALGAWRELTPLSDMETHFEPDPDRVTGYDASRPRDVTREPLYFYHFHNFFCAIRVDILHRMESTFGSTRQKRSPRIYRVIFYPYHGLGHPSSDSVFPGPAFGALIDRTDEPGGGERLDCMSSAFVHVRKTWDHVARTLGLKH